MQHEHPAPESVRSITIFPTFDAWRDAARALLGEGVHPEQVHWIAVTQTDVHSAASIAPDERSSGPRGRGRESVTVPKAFVTLAQRAARDTDPSRWALLYRLLWRLVHEDRDLLHDGTDADVEATTRIAAQADEAVQPLSLLGEPPSSASPFLPSERSLSTLRAAAERCTGCELYKRATQTVFGEGPPSARAVFIGEQPGDQEDIHGRPFVGPAGDVLTRALKEAGIPRDSVYITNVVKHFKWEPRGKRRIHLTPRQAEIEACRPWLQAEIDLYKPAAVVCLGSTAAQALMGSQFRIMRSRGQVFQTGWSPWLMATIHPSAILRMDDAASKQGAYNELVDDLRKVAARLREVE
jgi:uracil-DNA glycosylase family protein